MCLCRRPLVYTVSTLLPVAYIIGLIFTLKTHSHIYNVHVGEGQGMNQLNKLLCHTFWEQGFIWHTVSSCVSVCVCSDFQPWSSCPLVTVEVSGHPHHGHCTDVCLRRSCHWAHPAHTEPTQHLSGQHMCSSVTSQAAFIGLFPLLVLTFVCFLTKQYFISVTVLAMVPEIPEIVNGIQFALQNNISLR